MSWIGLDIGGANIKAAMANRKTISRPFRFWVQHERLFDELKSVISSFIDHEATHVAATMTAELADCFETRQQGVEQIVSCLESVCLDLKFPAPVFAGTDICFRTADEAKAQWLKTAAANWAMLARYASRFLKESTGLVIDMGSTTTDIIPVQAGYPITEGNTDLTRLQNGELVYVGFDRTPICSVVSSFDLNGSTVPIAREIFATVGDAMLMSDFCDEDVTDTDTADGRPRTKQHAAQRLCRMICEDSERIPRDQVDSIANQVIEAMEKTICTGLERVLSRNQMDQAIVTGSGKRFINHLLENHCLDIQTMALDSQTDAAAPALAVAVLAAERVAKEQQS